MKLDYTVKKIPPTLHNRKRSQGNNLDFVMEFVASGAPLAAIVLDPHEVSDYQRTMLNLAIQYMAAPVCIVKRGDDLYIRRTDKEATP